MASSIHLFAQGLARMAFVGRGCKRGSSYCLDWYIRSCSITIRTRGEAGQEERPLHRAREVLGTVYPLPAARVLANQATLHHSSKLNSLTHLLLTASSPRVDKRFPLLHIGIPELRIRPQTLCRAPSSPHVRYLRATFPFRHTA